MESSGGDAASADGIEATSIASVTAVSARTNLMRPMMQPPCGHSLLLQNPGCILEPGPGKGIGLMDDLAIHRLVDSRPSRYRAIRLTPRARSLPCRVRKLAPCVTTRFLIHARFGPGYKRACA